MRTVVTQWVYHGNQKPTEQNILEYKIYLKLFNKIKRKAIICYYKTVLDQNRHNTKQTWNILKKAIGKENNKANFPQSFNIDNNTVRNKKEIAHAFNTFFANIGYNVNHNVPQSNKSFISYLPNHNAKSIFLDPVIPADIFDITNKFKPKTSYGADGISTKLLIKTIDTIIFPKLTL